MNAQLAAAFAVLPNYLSQHVLLSLSAMALGAGVSLPLALWAARRPGLRWPLLAATSLVQTIPALA
ncbi:MAG: ABC transporter permease, partial [Rhodoblastus sp.]